jgi:hypothetical protein
VGSGEVGGRNICRLKEVSVHILILIQVNATHSAQYSGDIIMLAVRMG